MKSFQVEILGKAALEASLMGAGYEVAEPRIDNGIDMIAFRQEVDSIRFFPIQMKAASTAAFSIDRKYEAVPGLLMAYVWYLQDKSRGTSIWLMPYVEAIAIASQMGYTATESWQSKGRYVTTRPSEKLSQLLLPWGSLERALHAAHSPDRLF